MKRAFRLTVAATALLLEVVHSVPAAAQMSEKVFSSYSKAIGAYYSGDYVVAYRDLLSLAGQGHPGAQFNLALMYYNGHGVTQSYTKSAKWYRLAAEQGNASAQNNLGTMYAKGEGVPQDISEAMRWYKRAADQDNESVIYKVNLARMYYDGDGIVKNYVEAAKWYRRAAEQGHIDSQYNLALMHYIGEGVLQNYTEAAKWYRFAAEKGHAGAQNNLGHMYSKGLGVKQNYIEAAAWYRRAAEQGSAIAQFNLGIKFQDGEGIPQNYNEAVKWYRRAAEQGYTGAQNNLGLMYEYGDGVSRNLERAYMWFNLAASRTLATKDEERKRSVRNRDRVAALLTPAQLARAQAMAREWRPKTGADAETSPPPASRKDGLKAAIIEAQRGLARLGFDPGPPDGVVGAKTRAAIRAFQKASDLPVDGRYSAELEAYLAVALASADSGQESRPALETVSTGSGFRVSAEGHILTNAHVVKGCVEVHVPPAGRVSVAARDNASDLALLKGSPGKPFAAFRQGRGARPGAGVVAVGYPLRGVLASGANVTTGNVAALAGPGDDRRLIQITAPVQPGNSGGPVLDMAGNAVGVVVSKLDAVKMARATGDIPQNVNFAVSAGAARAFLDSEGVAYATAPSKDRRAPEDVAAAAKAFTLLIECRGRG